MIFFQWMVILIQLCNHLLADVNQFVVSSKVEHEQNYNSNEFTKVSARNRSVFDQSEDKIDRHFNLFERKLLSYSDFDPVLEWVENSPAGSSVIIFRRYF